MISRGRMETLNRNELRTLRGLRSRPVRERRGVFLLEGVRALQTALEAGAEVRLVALTAEIRDHQGFPMISELAAERGLPLRIADHRTLQELSTAVTSPGIIAAVVWEPLRGSDEAAIRDRIGRIPGGTLLALDAVADPGNVGSLIRAADAFGLDGVLLGTGCVEATNPKVVRGSVGSLFSLPLIAAGIDLQPVLSRLRDQGWKVYRAEAGGGTPLPDVSGARPWILLLGSEAHGVSRELEPLGEAIHINLTGAAESLNVAMAGGILMYGLTAAATPSS